MTFEPSPDGVVLDALIRDESAEEKEEEDAAASLLEIVFLIRGAPYS